MKIYNEIVMKDIEDIKPYFNNPRNNNKTIQALTVSISEVGFNVPIVIDKDNIIVKGHSRYHAAKLLNLKEIPCIISENTDKQNKADRIYDNAIQELSEWNYERLSMELRDVDFMIPEITFDLKELNNYMNKGTDIPDDINSSDIDKAKQGMLDEVSKITDRFTIPCPKCGEEIIMDINELLKHAKIVKDDKGN